MRTCSMCRVTDPLSGFGTHKSWCRVCVREYSRAWRRGERRQRTSRFPRVDGTKVCSRCGVGGDEHFFPSSLRRKGRTALCKKCRIEYYRQRGWSHKEATRLRKRKLSFVREYKLRHGCADCGANDDATKLVFHHPHDSNKAGNVSKMVANNRSWKLIKAEIAECVVLCMSCHMADHKQERHYERMAAAIFRAA